MVEPFNPGPSKTPAIAIILIASAITALIGCGGGFLLDSPGVFGNLAAPAMAILGLIAIAVFVVTAFIGVIMAITRYFRHD